MYVLTKRSELGQKKCSFSLNIGYDWVMKRWQFRAPCLGVFPKCHFINHRMDLPISRFLPDYIDTEHIIEITPGPAYIYHDEHPPSEMSTLIRNAKEMFWHWHVTYVWTLWPGEERGDGEGAGPGQDCDEWVSSGWRRDQARPQAGTILDKKKAGVKQWVLLVISTLVSLSWEI